MAEQRVVIQRAERPMQAISRPAIHRKQRNDPDFDTLFEADENPLESLPEYDGSIQESADREMSAVEAEIEANRAASAERFRIGTDEGYYLVMCFQTTEQKEQFLERAGWQNMGDKYINGLEVAQKLGVNIDVIPIEPRKLRQNPKKFSREEVI